MAYLCIFGPNFEYCLKNRTSLSGIAMVQPITWHLKMYRVGPVFYCPVFRRLLYFRQKGKLLLTHLHKANVKWRFVYENCILSLSLSLLSLFQFCLSFSFFPLNLCQFSFICFKLKKNLSCLLIKYKSERRIQSVDLI